jgi:hypothetical protein
MVAALAAEIVDAEAEDAVDAGPAKALKVANSLRIRVRGVQIIPMKVMTTCRKFCSKKIRKTLSAYRPAASELSVARLRARPHHRSRWRPKMRTMMQTRKISERMPLQMRNPRLVGVAVAAAEVEAADVAIAMPRRLHPSLHHLAHGWMTTAMFDLTMMTRSSKKSRHRRHLRPITEMIAHADEVGDEIVKQLPM